MTLHRAWLEAPFLSCPRCPAGAPPCPRPDDRTTMPSITPQDAVDHRGRRWSRHPSRHPHRRRDRPGRAGAGHRASPRRRRRVRRAAGLDAPVRAGGPVGVEGTGAYGPGWPACCATRASTSSRSTGPTAQDPPVPGQVRFRDRRHPGAAKTAWLTSGPNPWGGGRPRRGTTQPAGGPPLGGRPAAGTPSARSAPIVTAPTNRGTPARLKPVKELITARCRAVARPGRRRVIGHRRQDRPALTSPPPPSNCRPRSPI